MFPSIRGERLSRDALEHLVRKHCLTASRTCPSIGAKRVTPHTLRHSTAMNLLHHGVDQAVIALWLGHESPTSTHQYTQANLAMKEKALARMQEPDAAGRRFRASDSLLTRERERSPDTSELERLETVLRRLQRERRR